MCKQDAIQKAGEKNVTSAEIVSINCRIAAVDVFVRANLALSGPGTPGTAVFHIHRGSVASPSIKDHEEDGPAASNGQNHVYEALVPIDRMSVNPPLANGQNLIVVAAIEWTNHEAGSDAEVSAAKTIAGCPPGP